MTSVRVDDVSLRGFRGVFVCERKRLVGCWAGSEESRRTGGGGARLKPSSQNPS